MQVVNLLKEYETGPNAAECRFIILRWKKCRLFFGIFSKIPNP